MKIMRPQAAQIPFSRYSSGGKREILMMIPRMLCFLPVSMSPNLPP